MSRLIGVSLTLFAAVVASPLVGVVRAQDIRPLPAVESAEPRRIFDPQVMQAGVFDAKPIESAETVTKAEVERIVAEQLAKQAAEPGTIPASAEAPLPLPADTLPQPAAAEWYEVGSDKKLTASWNHGLELQSANKDFKVHVGGRTQFDTSFFANDVFLEVPGSQGGINGNLGGGVSQRLEDSMQFRRGRLRVDGTIYEQIDFAFEYDFVNDISVTPGSATSATVATTVPAITDCWVNFSKLPLTGNIKVGSFKNPLGFEHLTSSRFLDFIERSFNQDLFYGPFNNGFSGIAAWDGFFDDHATYNVGVFASNANSGTNISGYGIGNDYTLSMRGTLLPWYDADGRFLVHFGTTTEFRDADDGHVRVRTRGNIRNGPPGPFNAVYADTTYLLADDQDLINFEGVVQWGSLLIQGEYCYSLISDAVQVVNVPAPTPRGDVGSSGMYLEALVFLTGEHRAYNRKTGFFERVVPHQNAFRVRARNGGICNGPGAWQVGIRYDHADLNDGGINGGELDALTLGLNWFLNPNMKLQLNTDWTHRSSVRTNPAQGVVFVTPEGDIFGLGTRLAIDF